MWDVGAGVSGCFVTQRPDMRQGSYILAKLLHIAQVAVRHLPRKTHMTTPEDPQHAQPASFVAAPQHSRRLFKVALFLFALVSIVVAVWLFTSKNTEIKGAAASAPSQKWGGKRGDPTRRPMTVQTALAKTGNIHSIQTARGPIVPRSTVTIRSRAAGPCMSVLFTSGSMV